MANSKNQTQNTEVKNQPIFKEVVVNNFSDSTKYPEYKMLYFKERKMLDDFGIEVESTTGYICLIPDLYFSPFVGKRCRLTLQKAKNGWTVITRIELLDTTTPSPLALTLE